jgi:hypothetical protein
MPTRCVLRGQVSLETVGERDSISGCYLMMRPLPLVFAALPAPLEVILLVCISSPMYLHSVSTLSCVRGRWHNSRLQKAVTALEFFMLVLDDFDAIDNLHQTGLQLFRLSGCASQRKVQWPAVRLKRRPAAVTSSRNPHGGRRGCLGGCG